MCLSIAEHRRPPASLSAEWLNDSGRVVHPAAPQGVGGPGAFRAAGVLAGDGERAMLPHPRSPAVKSLDPSRVRQADELEAAKVVRQPPPKVTETSAEVIKGITVTMKNDSDEAEGVEGAVTDFTQSSTGKVDYALDDDDLVETITDKLKYSVEIQTRYGTGKPDDDAEYGRGTTLDDTDKGNVTLGFHESCHRQDLLDFFRNNPVPKFAGKKQQSEPDFQAAIETHAQAWEDYFKKARTNTVKVTDETGDPTMTEYFAAQ